MSVDNLGAEPVLGNAAFHVDLERTADVRAGHIVPSNVDNANALGCEIGERVGEEIKMVLAAAGALVDNLEGKVSNTELCLEPSS